MFLFWQVVVIVGCGFAHFLMGRKAECLRVLEWKFKESVLGGNQFIANQPINSANQFI